MKEYKITRGDYIKSSRRASREIEIERGFNETLTKVHKSKKTYSKPKYKNWLNEDEDLGS